MKVLTVIISAIVLCFTLMVSSSNAQDSNNELPVCSIQIAGVHPDFDIDNMSFFDKLALKGPSYGSHYTTYYHDEIYTVTSFSECMDVASLRANECLKQKIQGYYFHVYAMSSKSAAQPHKTAGEFIATKLSFEYKQGEKVLYEGEIKINY